MSGVRSYGRLLGGVACLGLAACGGGGTNGLGDALAPAAGTQVEALGAAPERPATGQLRAGDSIPDEWIVLFKDEVQDAPGLTQRLVRESKGTLRFEFDAVVRGFAGKLPPQAVAGLRRNPQIAAIEPDRWITAEEVQLSPPSWGLDRIDQRPLPLSATYDDGNGGANAHVYIVDTGIRTTHADFGGRASGAYSVISDGNGTNDCHGHGTHVAGTVGGTAYGVAKLARLYAVRVMDCAGSGSSSGIVAALDWVARNGARPAVINMSLGGSVSSTINTAVQNAVNAGVTVVVSAGNRSTDACTQSPASAPAAVTVASTNSGDGQSGFSNFGSCVDIYAPGEGIASAYHTADNATATMSGTSMAAPHVAGAAALVLSANPSATPAQVAQALSDNATTNLVTSIGAGSPNRLLFIGFVGSSSPLPPPPSPTPPPPPPGNVAPTASFTGSCAGGRSLCTFDATGSTDDKAIVRYEWTFGDGSATQVTTSRTTSYRYPRTGTFTVRLTVVDAEGLSSSATRTVTVRRM